MKAKIEHYFAHNSNDVCFSTSNELIFHLEHDAIAHGNGLEDNNVQKHERAEYKSPLLPLSIDLVEVEVEVKAEEVVAAVEEAEGIVEALLGAKAKAKSKG